RGSLSGKKRVLDFGCGGGFLIPALSRVAGEVYGVDFSPTSVELTNERNANIANFRGATSPMEALDAGLKFDGILSVEVIEHLSDEQLAGTLDIIKRLLTPGGVIAFTTPNDEDLGAWGQVRRAFRAIGNGRDTGLPHRVASGTLP
ncbi:MAG: class I SAM-dependent methyltransferase, partial [Polyangiales bacterium]